MPYTRFDNNSLIPRQGLSTTECAGAQKLGGVIGS
jgi:hypothetical protein